MAMFDGRRKRHDQNEIRNEKELFIIQQFAQLKSVAEVTELCNKKFPSDKPISEPAIRYYKETRAPIIEQMRDKFISKAMHIPIANERVRLKRTEDLYNAASSVVAKNDNQILSAIDVSLKCLKGAREEVKGESGNTQNFLQFNQYNELTDEQLMDKKKELEKKFIELSKKGDDRYEVQSVEK